MASGEYSPPSDTPSRLGKGAEELEAENAALIEQLDALMDFERRLKELQEERNRELARVRVLNDFALEVAADASSAEIIRRSLDLLGTRFDLEQVVAVHCDEDKVLLYVASRSMQ